MTNINPTRMELQKQKARLKTARRGHKLLKDKCDEMVRNYMILARQNKDLREELDLEISKILREFAMGQAGMQTEETAHALDSAPQTINIKTSKANIMGLWVPKFIMETIDGFAMHSTAKTTAGFDRAISKLRDIVAKLLELGQIEKSCDMLSAEIIKIRRRINALEFILIPEIDRIIRFIRLKLAENERSQIVRVMKLKAQNHQT